MVRLRFQEFRCADFQKRVKATAGNWSRGAARRRFEVQHHDYQSVIAFGKGWQAAQVSDFGHG